MRAILISCGIVVLSSLSFGFGAYCEKQLHIQEDGFCLKDATATGEQVKVFNGDSVGTGTVFEKDGRLYVLSNRFVMSPTIEWADGSKGMLEIGDPKMDWVMLPVMGDHKRF